MINFFKTLIQKLKYGKKGQGILEYGLILGFIAMVVVAILSAMGRQLLPVFRQIIDTLAH